MINAREHLRQLGKILEREKEIVDKKEKEK